MTPSGPKLHFVTGKGGVGKSLLALSLALKLAREGRKVLISELGEHSFIGLLYNKPIGLKPIPLTENLMAVRWAGEECLKEYILHFVKIEKMVDLFFENRVMKALVQAAPALKELAVLGKITSGNRRVGPALVYDDIVIDAFATGHFRALLQAPIGMADAIQFGPMGEQCRSIDRVVRDENISHFYVAVIPEELPVTEGIELADYLKTSVQRNVTIIKNRWLEPPLNLQELTQLGETAGDGEGEFARFLQFQMQRQQLFDARLQAYKPTLQIPFYFLPATVELAEKLSQHWKSQ